MNNMPQPGDRVQLLSNVHRRDFGFEGARAKDWKRRNEIIYHAGEIGVVVENDIMQSPLFTGWYACVLLMPNGELFVPRRSDVCLLNGVFTYQSARDRELSYFHQQHSKV